MTNYIIVYKNGENADWCTTLKLKNTQPSLILFICRKETVHSYSYGEHANYAFCNKDGIDAPLKVGDVTISSLKHMGQRGILSSHGSLSIQGLRKSTHYAEITFGTILHPSTMNGPTRLKILST